MRIIYLANIRLPTEKAHGIAIMKMCEALAQAGAGVQLVVSGRRTTLLGDPFKVYGVVENFAIRRLPVIDLFPILWVARKIAFFVESLAFYVSLFCWLFFRSRDQFVYTRDIGAIGISCLLGFEAVYECHAAAKRRGFFFLVRRARRVIVISRALKDIFIREGIDPEKILVSPSGVDVELFSGVPSKVETRRMLGIPLNEFVAVYTGTFTTMGEDKGLADTLEALRYAPQVNLVAVGGAPEDVERYRAQAEVLGISGRTKFVGYVPQATIAQYNAAADVLLMPFPDRPHYRNHMSPMKMVEYMASRRPVVATDLPTIREVVDESTAIIIHPGDPQALVEALNRLRENPEFGKDLAARAFERVGKYSWEERAKRVLGFIR